MIFFSHADWCGACQATKPEFYKFAEWAKENRPQLRIAGINYNEATVLTSRFAVSYLPTFF